jgi:quinol monooxygenase YgiN
MTIIYEVNLVVDSDIVTEYRSWLSTHVQEMLALPGFLGARILETSELEPSEPEGGARTTFCTQYELVDQAALDAYFRAHAGRMRADGISRFGDRFSASRRVLHEIGRY